MGEANHNRCGGCSACCDAFPIDEIGKPTNETCPHYDNGCAIHDTKPRECADFDCAYLQGRDVPVSIRPDKCGIVFEKLSSRLFYGTVIGKVTDKGVGQTQSFLDQGYSVVLYTSTGGSSRTFYSPDHDKVSVQQEFGAHIEVRYGNLRD